jgi:hypothetical protein
MDRRSTDLYSAHVCVHTRTVSLGNWEVNAPAVKALFCRSARRASVPRSGYIDAGR